jgi:hypothetical protein
MKFTLMAAVALLSTSAFAQTADFKAELATRSVQYRSINVVAAQSFDRWLEQDSEAQAVAAFTVAHPGRTKMLLEWALQNPFGDLNAFNESHRQLASELANNPNGAANLISWARQNAGAVRAMLASPEGFKLLVSQAK